MWTDQMPRTTFDYLIWILDSSGVGLIVSYIPIQYIWLFYSVPFHLIVIWTYSRGSCMCKLYDLCSKLYYILSRVSQVIFYIFFLPNLLQATIELFIVMLSFPNSPTYCPLMIMCHVLFMWLTTFMQVMSTASVSGQVQTYKTILLSM